MKKKTEATAARAYADGIPVYCAHDAIVPIGKLKPNPKNPNRHPDEQIARLGAVIRGNGWRNPITVSNRSGFIVKGHGRLLAALHEDLEEVPVDFQNYDSEAAEIADLMADNKIAELSEADEKQLAALFEEIGAEDLPIERTGYSVEEYTDIAAALSAAMNAELEADPDDAPEAAQEVVSRPGDIWILGDHHVMCGDCTDAATVQLLTGGGISGSRIHRSPVQRRLHRSRRRPCEDPQRLLRLERRGGGSALAARV